MNIDKEIRHQVTEYEQMLDFIAPVDQEAKADELEYIEACELVNSEEN